MAKYRDNIAAIKLIKQLDLEQFVNDVIAGKVTTESIDTKALDEETYAKAKPLFQQAIKNFSQAGADIKEMMRAIINEVLNRFGKDVAVRMKPYVIRFMEDVKSAAMDEVAPPASQPSTPAIEKIKKLPKDRQKKVMELALLKAEIKTLECQLNAGLDPETMLDGITLSGYHIEAGVCSFGQFVQVMAEDLGTSFGKIRPYLRTWFNGARDMLEDAGIDVSGIDGPDAVRAELARMDSQFEEQGKEPNQLSDTDLERDREDAGTQEQKLLPVLARIMDAAFRLGYIKFKDAAKFVIDAIRAKLGGDVADQITLDYLQVAYISMAGKYGDKASTKREVISVESLNELNGDTNEPDQRSSTNLERDRQDAITQDGVRADGGRDGGIGEPGIRQPDQDDAGQRGERVPGREAVAGGTEGDFSPFADPAGTEDGTAGSELDQRSGDLGFDGPTIEPAGAEATDSVVTSGLDLARERCVQANAQTVPDISADLP